MQQPNTDRNSQITNTKDKNRSNRESSQQTRSGSSGASDWAATVGSVLAAEAASYAPQLLETVYAGIQKKLGNTKMEKWVSLLNLESVSTGQSVAQNLLRSAFPDFPEDLEVTDIPSLMKWEPIKSKIAKYPIASSAVIVAGVGALYLLSESSFLKGTTKASVKTAAKSAVKKLAGKAKKAAKKSKR